MTAGQAGLMLAIAISAIALLSVIWLAGKD